MALLNILGKILGNKYDKDIKTIMPIVEKIKLEESRIKEISHNKLREETDNLKRKISQTTLPLESEIKKLKYKAEEEIPPEEKESLYDQIDNSEKELVLKIEETCQ